jgi:hypothetical protein
MLLFSTEDLKWETYQTTKVYLAHSYGGSRAQHWHQLGSAEDCMAVSTMATVWDRESSHVA